MSEPFVTQSNYEEYRIPMSPKPASARKGETLQAARARTVKKFYSDRADSQARVAQRRSDDRAESMAQHAYDARISPQGNRASLSPSQTTFPSDMTRELGPNEAASLANKYRKFSPPLMDVSELSEGPNLPHRDLSGISGESRDRYLKTGYYGAGVDGYSSDAYMEKIDPITRKAGSKRAKRLFTTSGEEYVNTHGAGAKKVLRVRNKHLMYKSDPTAREAVANVMREATDNHDRERVATYQLHVERDMLLMLAKVHDIQAKRGKLQGDNRAEMLREIFADTEPGEMVAIDFYSPSDVQALQGAPKMYRKGHFGAFLKDCATHFKINK